MAVGLIVCLINSLTLSCIYLLLTISILLVTDVNLCKEGYFLLLILTLSPLLVNRLVQYKSMSRFACYWY